MCVYSRLLLRPKTDRLKVSSIANNEQPIPFMIIANIKNILFCTFSVLLVVYKT